MIRRKSRATLIAHSTQCPGRLARDPGGGNPRKKLPTMGRSAGACRPASNLSKRRGIATLAGLIWPGWNRCIHGSLTLATIRGSPRSSKIAAASTQPEEGGAGARPGPGRTNWPRTPAAWSARRGRTAAAETRRSTSAAPRHAAHPRGETETGW